MKIITGLGNPGREYVGTRHNAGFDVLAVLARELNIDMGKRPKRRAFVGEGVFCGEKVVICAPQTFMNLSGEALVLNMGFYKVSVEDIIVVYDDCAIKAGEIRVRKKGSAGGHNGVKNIILNLDTDEFVRVRVGINEKPAGWELKDYVLSRFGKDEQEDYVFGVGRAVDAVKEILRGGVDGAMNLFNRRGE